MAKDLSFLKECFLKKLKFEKILKKSKGNRFIILNIKLENIFNN